MTAWDDGPPFYFKQLVQLVFFNSNAWLGTAMTARPLGFQVKLRLHCGLSQPLEGPGKLWGN